MSCLTPLEEKLLGEAGSSRRERLFWCNLDRWFEMLSRDDAEEVRRLARDYKESLFDNLKHCDAVKMDYEKDRRRPEEYVYDVIEGWFFEDLFKLWIKRKIFRELPGIHFEIKASGRDSDRKFVFRKTKKEYTSSEPDFTIFLPRGTVGIELQNSRSGERDIYDIKQNKAARLLTYVGEEHSDAFLFFTLMPSDLRYFVLPANAIKNLRSRDNKSYGGKKTRYISHEDVIKGGWGMFHFDDRLPGFFISALRRMS